MKYYIFIENGKLNGGGQCRQLTDGVENIEVSEKLYNAYIEDSDKYVWDGSEIVENPDYEQIIKKKQTEEKKVKILEQLDDLDKKRIRAICEDEIKDEASNQTWLEFYNAQIYDLRLQLKELNI